ncbi:LOW QUALITY PROTEIN: hypothetical protein BDA96_10G287600 [Sorghum bicolor]|uniref:BTB domain-containing protein n=1 Tax=Sorghum bicolor TaxID=4558 RepID=A0A921Q745_SORBI|nr:LOW QUALITY PROTEIN: hypothetical protein BDA96_10G287600 [Sorghum bicolor]
MKPATAITKITEAARSVQLLQIDGYSATETMSKTNLDNDSLTVECSITVLRELPEVVFPPPATTEMEEVPPPTPSSDLHKHLGELLESKKGADVTFLLASSAGGGERFPAHKTVLAARSRVFMAEFFGGMEERTSRVVEVQDVDPAAFEAMLRFVYTDVAPPELDDDDDEDEPAAAVTIWPSTFLRRRTGTGSTGSRRSARPSSPAASTSAPRPRRWRWPSSTAARCSRPMRRLRHYIGSPETLDAVLATEGYAHLAASCPLVLAELLKSARGKKN